MIKQTFVGLGVVGLAMLATACAVDATPGSGPASAKGEGNLAVMENSPTTFDGEYLAANGDSLRVTVRFTATTTLYSISSSQEGTVLLEGTEKVAKPDRFAPGYNGEYAPLTKGTALYDAVRDLQDQLRGLGVSERPDDAMKGTPLYGAGWMSAQLLGDIPDLAIPDDEASSPQAINAWLSAHQGDLNARAWPVPELSDVAQLAHPEVRTDSYIPGNYGSCGGFPALDYCCGPLNCRDGQKTNQGPCILPFYCPYNCGTECAAGDLCFWVFGSAQASKHYTYNGQSLPYCGTPWSASQSWVGGSCPHSDAYMFATNGGAQGFLNNYTRYAASTKCCNSDSGCQKP